MAPIATLTVRLSAQIAEFQKSFADTSGTLKKFTNEFEGVATKAAAVGSFFGTIAADIAKSIAAGFGRAVGDAIRLSSEFSNALIGLGSVSRAFGIDVDAAKDAARGLSADGLMPLKDSATGLKNLLATGFSLDQAVTLMDAFKDSAAFGRQGALSFGDAVRSATEGVKNGNSILVDNAGVTKNLSQILKEAGFSAQDLSKAGSDAAVRMALFNGILKETRAQTGDAERLTMTYTGQVSRLGAAYDQTLATMGAAITQNESVATAIRAVGDTFSTLNTYLVQNRNAFNLVSDAVIFISKALSNTLHVVDLLQTGFAGLQITFNETARAGLEMARDMLTVASTAAHLRAAIDPVFGDEWKKKAILADIAIGQINRHILGFVDASKDAEDRSIRWGNTLQSGVAKIDALTASLEKSRGKTVELGAATSKTTDETNRHATATTTATKAAREFGVAVDQNMTPQVRTLGTEIPVSVDALTALGDAIKTVQGLSKNGIIPDAPARLGVDVGLPTIPGQPSGKSGLGSIFGSSAEFGQQLAGTILGSLQGGGNPLSAAAGMVGSKVGSTIASSLTKTGGALFGTALGGVLNSALPIIGSLAGPLVEKLWGTLFGTEGRDTKLAMADKIFGGVKAMQDLMVSTLSKSEYDRLWKQFSEVGQNDKKQAEAAVKAISAALDEQKKKEAEVAEAAAESGKKQQEALDEISAKYKTRLDEIDSRYKTLSDSVAKEAEEEHMGLTEMLEREEMKRLEDKKIALEAERDAEIAAKKETFAGTFDEAKDLDDKMRDMFEKGYKIPIRFDFPDGMPGVVRPSDLPAGVSPMSSSGWESHAPATVTAGGRGGTVQVVIDGRLMAQTVVPHIPGEVKRLGLNR